MLPLSLSSSPPLRGFFLLLSLAALFSTSIQTQAVTQCEKTTFFAREISDKIANQIDIYYTRSGVRSAEECAVFCAKRKFCRSLLYNPVHSNCSLSYSATDNCRVERRRYRSLPRGEPSLLLITCIRKCSDDVEHEIRRSPLNRVKAVNGVEVITAEARDGTGKEGGEAPAIQEDDDASNEVVEERTEYNTSSSRIIRRLRKPPSLITATLDSPSTSTSTSTNSPSTLSPSTTTTYNNMLLLTNLSHLIGIEDVAKRRNSEDLPPQVCFRTKKGRFLLGGSFKRIAHLTIEQCRCECANAWRMAGRCSSFNFFSNGMCVLNSGSHLGRFDLIEERMATYQYVSCDITMLLGIADIVCGEMETGRTEVSTKPATVFSNVWKESSETTRMRSLRKQEETSGRESGIHSLGEGSGEEQEKEEEKGKDGGSITQMIRHQMAEITSEPETLMEATLSTTVLAKTTETALPTVISTTTPPTTSAATSTSTTTKEMTTTEPPTTSTSTVASTTTSTTTSRITSTTTSTTTSTIPAPSTPRRTVVTTLEPVKETSKEDKNEESEKDEERTPKKGKKKDELSKKTKKTKGKKRRIDESDEEEEEERGRRILSSRKSTKPGHKTQECFEELFDYVMTSTAGGLEHDVSIEECKCLCANSLASSRYAFQCLSATYYHNERDCVLNVESRRQRPELLERHHQHTYNVTYLGLDCTAKEAVRLLKDESLEAGCIQPFSTSTLPPTTTRAPILAMSKPFEVGSDSCFLELPRFVLEGTAQAVEADVSIEQCKCYCADAERRYKGDSCLSVQYFPQGRICLLNKRNRFTNPETFNYVPLSPQNYYEAKCISSMEMTMAYVDNECMEWLTPMTAVIPSQPPRQLRTNNSQDDADEDDDESLMEKKRRRKTRKNRKKSHRRHEDAEEEEDDDAEADEEEVQRRRKRPSKEKRRFRKKRLPLRRRIYEYEDEEYTDEQLPVKRVLRRLSTATTTRPTTTSSTTTTSTTTTTTTTPRPTTTTRRTTTSTTPSTTTTTVSHPPRRVRINPAIPEAEGFDGDELVDLMRSEWIASKEELLDDERMMEEKIQNIRFDRDDEYSSSDESSEDSSSTSSDFSDYSSSSESYSASSSSEEYLPERHWKKTTKQPLKKGTRKSNWNIAEHPPSTRPPSSSTTMTRSSTSTIMTKTTSSYTSTSTASSTTQPTTTTSPFSTSTSSPLMTDKLLEDSRNETMDDSGELMSSSPLNTTTTTPRSTTPRRTTTTLPKIPRAGPCSYSTIYQTSFRGYRLIKNLEVANPAECLSACHFYSCRSANLYSAGQCELFRDSLIDYRRSDLLGFEHGAVYFDGIQCEPPESKEEEEETTTKPPSTESPSTEPPSTEPPSTSTTSSPSTTSSSSTTTA